MPAPAEPVRPRFINWVAIKYLPSGVSSRSSGERVPQRTSMSPWTPHATSGGPAGGGGGCCAPARATSASAIKRENDVLNRMDFLYGRFYRSEGATNVRYNHVRKNSSSNVRECDEDYHLFCKCSFRWFGLHSARRRYRPRRKGLGRSSASRHLSASAPSATAMPRWSARRLPRPSGKCRRNGSTPRSPRE